MTDGKEMILCAQFLLEITLRMKMTWYTIEEESRYAHILVLASVRPKLLIPHISKFMIEFPTNQLNTHIPNPNRCVSMLQKC